MSKRNDKQDGQRQWRVDVSLSNEGDEAVASVDLFVEDAMYEAHGKAPREKFSPTIGDELAVARALSALAHQLVDSASREVERTSQAVTAYDQATRAAASELNR